MLKVSGVVLAIIDGSRINDLKGNRLHYLELSTIPILFYLLKSQLLSVSVQF